MKESGRICYELNMAKQYTSNIAKIQAAKDRQTR